MRGDRLIGVAVQALANPPPWGPLEWNPRQTEASSTCRTAAATRLAARGLPCFRAPRASSRAVCTSRGPGWVSTNAGAAASGCSRKEVPALLRLLSSCRPVSEAAATRSASVSPPAAADRNLSMESCQRGACHPDLAFRHRLQQQLHTHKQQVQDSLPGGGPRLVKPLCLSQLEWRLSAEDVRGPLAQLLGATVSVSV